MFLVGDPASARCCLSVSLSPLHFLFPIFLRERNQVAEFACGIIRL